MAKMKGNSDLSIAGKGVPTSVLKETYAIEHYKTALFKNTAPTAKYRQFRSLDHIVTHCDVEKVALSADNDKVFQLSPCKSRPLGHYKNTKREFDEPCNDWELDDSGDEAVQVVRNMCAQAPLAIVANAEELEIAELSDVEFDNDSD